MAFTDDQNEPKLPVSNVEPRNSSDLLPRFYRTKSNKKFLQATLDQLIQPGTVKKVNGYVGRQNAKAVTADDIFLQAPSIDRQNYQLEPAAVIKDYLGNTTFVKDYIDHINHIDVFDGNVKNHSRLNKQEFYSWNPHIDWDKFVNYQQYYWLPFGPDVIDVSGQQLAIQSTFSVKGIDEEDNVAYLFTPNGLTRNPVIRLFRGQTYNFDIDAVGHPFNIKTTRTSGDLDRYNKGISANGVEKGTITFEVPLDAPDVLFYVSGSAIDTGGVFKILDIDENTFLDIDQDLIGKKTYTIPVGEGKGINLSNGMKVKFIGQVVPEIYSQGLWYIEGVGNAITLIAEKDLEVRSTYSEEKSILFDDIPFDQLPFSETGAFPSKKDYVTINRSSLDNNPWSRYNRWFHQDVITISAEVNGRLPQLDQLSRATRPVIEFNAGLKLHNYGTTAKKGVDLIDNFTTDVFSTIEGSTGYNVDGIDLADGMRVLFNADTDSTVKNKIFKVNFINIVKPGRELTFDSNTSVDINADTIVFSKEHGLTSQTRVTYIANDENIIAGLTNRQIYYVKVVNTFAIELHTNKELTKKVDIFATSTGAHKFEVYSGKVRQIYLSEEPDAMPELYNTVAVRFGQNEQLNLDIKGNQSQNYWFNGETWKLAQYKLTVNQPPLFDVFDDEQISYSDVSKYEGSTFTGTKVFSYKLGQGQVDNELGFSLSYQNINNIGDIVFEFNLLKDKFSYKDDLVIREKNTDAGFLKIVNSYGDQFENSWKTSLVEDIQPVIRIFKDSSRVNNFPVDVFDNKELLSDLQVRVYINGIRLDKNLYQLQEDAIRKIVVLDNDVALTDVVTLKCFTKQHKNNNGYYEIPISLQNNPLNENIQQFTLGQVVDHVDSIVDNLSQFNGAYPGNGNLRDLGNLSAYGTRFVQHSSPLNIALYHLGTKNANVIKALDKARNDYGQFKRAFLIAATESGIDTDPKRHVDYILQKMVLDKPKSSPYYLSDMFGYSAANRLEYNVLDSRIKIYPLTEKFNLKTLSNKSVNIYLNGEQLLEGRDYKLGDDVFFEVLVDLVEDDLLEAYEYETTDGCFCPPTPTKLGIYPKYEPKKYIDTSYLEPVEVIRGHDGSVVLTYGDYRDDLILELEKRIFNNIKVAYDPNIFDIFNFVPGYNRQTAYTREEFDKVMAKYFFQWTQNISQDYTKHDVYDRLNPFTFNYRGNVTPDQMPVPASWRGIYLWLFDTTTPQLTPWEMLGYSCEPAWWKDLYGSAPYTSDNFIMWDDIKTGTIREPNKPPVRIEKFARPILEIGVPVNDQGSLVDPYNAGYLTGTIRAGNDGFFIFGDVHTVESAWRRSSYYPFALIETALLLEPNYVLGRTLDRSRIVRNLNNQLVYSETGLRIKLSDLLVPSTAKQETTDRIYTSGLINYIVDYFTSDNTARISSYADDLKSLTNNITTRLGSFTSKPKYKILLDSKNPSSSGGVFVPEENYNINLNISSAVKKINYSGVIITKFPDGFEIKGYNFSSPYFNFYLPNVEDRLIRVGGISESFINWNSGKFYVAGKIVRYNNQFFRVKVSHTSEETFENNFYAKLPNLPIIGGREAMIHKSWDTRNLQTLAYGTKLTSIQEVVDFIEGYGVYLEEQGFVFDDFNAPIALVSNWETSIKEFMFWTTQNWAEGSVISLSPAANRLRFNSNLTVVEDITDQFNGYSVCRVDGQKLDPEFIQVYRSGNEFVLEPESTNYGIFGVTLFLVQKEHVAVLDDTTLFNDIIYDRPAGYRQQRVKVLGYIVSNWKGGFEIPGFIYDEAKIQAWGPWTDYNLGDIVKHKEFYYSAKEFIPGSETFNDKLWFLLTEKPTSELLPNLDYKAEQFTDFYDLDTDNFDVEQQKVAQHLIGYQNRQYLENIIQNDVSQYKFYQGMIAEKGTLNVLSKLFDVLSADGQESLAFDEEWAFRVGEYGALDTFEEIEFILDESQFKIKPQPFEVVDSINPSVADFVYRQRPVDAYIKPVNFSENVLPTITNKEYFRPVGYVRPQDVNLSVDSLDILVQRSLLKDTDPLFINPEDYSIGNYIWTAFDPTIILGKAIYWDVYRINSLAVEVQNLTYTNNVVTVTLTTSAVDLLDTYLKISNTDKVNGFVKVKSVNGNTFTFDKTIVGPIGGFNNIDLFILKRQRIETIDSLQNLLSFNIKPGELVWVDNNENNFKAVYKNEKVFSSNAILNSDTVNTQFGSNIAVSADGNHAAVKDINGVTVYLKGSSDNSWQSISRLNAPATPVGVDFGTDIKFSKDSNVLAISSVATRQVFVFVKEFSGRYILNTTINNLATTFGTSVDLAKNGNEYILAISSPGFDSGKGKISIYKQNLSGNFILQTEVLGTANQSLGSKIKISENASAIFASCIESNQPKLKIYSYNFTNTVNLLQTISAGSITPATEILPFDISLDANYFALTEFTLNGNSPTGKVLIYKKNSLGVYVNHQTINQNQSNSSALFATSVNFSNNSQTLLVTSLLEKCKVDIYDRYNNNFAFGETIETPYTAENYNSLTASGNNVIVISEFDDVLGGSLVTSFVRQTGLTSWQELYVQEPKADVSKIKKAFLYNKKTNKIISYIDLVDATQGKIPGIADQEIKFKTYFDPAVYAIGNSTVAVDEGISWTSDHVGMLWWDLSRAKFLSSDIGDVVYKSSSWNKLYDSASVDVYEWVESTLLPSAWNKQSETEAGLVKGISGQTKYGDDVYSVKKTYDTVSKKFKEVYYFWVKNKKTTPQVEGRTLNANDVAELIADPAGYGYPCLALLSKNSLSFVNLEKYVENKDTVLHVQYWTSDSKETNYHSEWKLLSTNRNTIIPKQLEEKWFHSLVGKDDQDRLVPDINLPAKQKYGIEFRPRQSMFVNRIEALKYFVDGVNNVLTSKLITDSYDISDLLSSDPTPSAISAKWDIAIDTDAELRFVSTAVFRQAEITPIIIDGKLTDFIVQTAGTGYGKSRPYQLDENNVVISWYGPEITITGAGQHAKAQTIVNFIGHVIGAVILNQGENYDDNTVTTIRPFTVLVKADAESNNSWSTYSWNNSSKQWFRTATQKFNVTRYWKYQDWYAAGYNQFVKIDYLFDNTYQLVTTDVPLGSIVKIKNIGTGGWVLLEKFNNVKTIDYTENFNVIGRQHGTIQLLDTLYRTDKGYDTFLLDSTLYDNYPVEELRIILKAVRDKILIDRLRVEYLKLFFATVRYVMHEQTFVDWAFKTSFVKSQHNVGELKQKVNYNSDNLEFFEEYIKEVKPYRSKIREYVSNYSKVDPTQTTVTDFDLLPVIGEDYQVSPLTVNVVGDKIETVYPEILDYPWKHWTDNVGFTITSVQVIDGGSNYSSTPIVEVVGSQLPGGTPAVVKAYLSNGKVNRLELVNPGSRWTSAPQIVFKGGNGETGTTAKAVTIIGNSVVRSSLVKVKFDRLSKAYEITDLQETETFVGQIITGTRSQFNLKWSPEIKIGSSKVVVNGAELLLGQYTLTTAANKVNGYTKYTGTLTLAEPPAVGSVIVITYTKNFNHLTAVDRINFYYNPVTGQVGKDLSQLMTGIDYGGVSITGLDFGIDAGWDANPWFTAGWDEIDSSFNDYNVIVDPVTYEFRLPFVPEQDEEINIYVSRLADGRYQPPVRIDDINYLTINQTNDDALMTTFIGDGEVDIINLPASVNLEVSDRVIFRKKDSDGSYFARADEYDTLLSGGDLAYTSATGFAPDDILLDGDDFVTPTSSHAPEEFVPGHISDAVAIKVYHRPAGGCPNIMFNNHKGDGETIRFKIGQYFPNSKSVIVKVDDTVLTVNVDYGINYQTNEIDLNFVPPAQSTISIISISFNAENILDLDYFIADGVTKEYITNASWLPTVFSTVLVNGEVTEYDIFSTDDRYTDLVGQTWRSRVGISFPVPPPAGAIINYMIDYSGIQTTSSVVRSEIISYQEGQSTYELINRVGNDLPYESNVLIKIGQQILTPPSVEYFNADSSVTLYPITDYKYTGTILNASDLTIYRNNQPLVLGIEYNLIFNYIGVIYGVVESSIELIGGTGYSVGDGLEILGGSVTITGSPAKFEVTRVNSSGGILELEVLDIGSYTEPLQSPIEIVGGTGTGAIMSADFELINDRSKLSIELIPGTYENGDLILVVVKAQADYFINDDVITFTDTYEDGTEIEVLSFYNHDILGIERTVDRLTPNIALIPGTREYFEVSEKLGGTFTLRQTALSGDFVWIIKNGNLLMNNVDYTLEDDRTTIKLAEYLTLTDTVEVIAFTNTVVTESFGYMQFKDMLNRVHYKRLNKDKTTLLAQGLRQFDKEIIVEDSSVLDEPIPSRNIPGIIELNGERIEYFTKIGNVLGQLRRGTLGTGIPELHYSGLLIQNLGPSETIPYKDTMLVKTAISDGTSNEIILPYVPNTNNVEVFVGGYRLKKSDYIIYNNTEFPYSPEGNEILPAEFSVTGTTILKLTTVPRAGVKTVIVKKQGKLWNDIGKRLATSDNPVANFVSAVNVSLPPATFGR
jgi:hypothetical protein